MKNLKDKEKAKKAIIKGLSKTKTGKKVIAKVEDKAKRVAKKVPLTMSMLGVAKAVHDKKVDVKKDLGKGVSVGAEISETPRVYAKYKKKMKSGKKVEVKGSASRKERKIAGSISWDID